MYRKLTILVFGISFLFFSCQREELVQDGKTDFRKQIETLNAEDYVQGEMRIRVSPSMAKSLEEKTDSIGIVSQAKAQEVSSYFEAAGVIRMKRTFPYAGKFEARTRAEGLNLWYDVRYNKQISLKKAGNSLALVDGIDEVELRPKAKMTGYTPSVELALKQAVKSTKVNLPFDDPDLDRQWHYYNNGEYNDLALEGCDIDVVPVWENYTTGNADVIVSVVDGGIDYTHEDLSANMWINEAELNGSQGVDDDGNGYVDDIRGFNFVISSGKINAHEHGTHVAGTIGAVNNNGIGVAGVAGGDFKNDVPGVRLMSCQIFDGDDSGNGAAAIKYGADNGAVISQNSWGYPEGTATPLSDRMAIDYFTKYAGIDENGNQVGPMKGGIVIFAAGNENREEGYPASYEGALAVAALAQDYKRAYYSNYGAWVDVAAPGGDYNKGALILSTVPGNQYGSMQGTSMACPHVSGVAALVVSYAGGPGFTNADLWSRIVNSTKNIDSYNNALTGKLGSGLVDVFGAIAGFSTVAPAKVSEISGSALSNNINLSVKIPVDTDDKKPYGIDIYYSTSSFTTNLQGLSKMSFKVGDLNSGEYLSATLSALDFSTTYYLAAIAYDYAGNESPVSAVISVNTLSNNNPVINPLNETSATLKAYQNVDLKFEISDPDNHAISWTFTKSSTAVVAQEMNGVVDVTITGRNTVAGTYSDTLVVTDAYGASASQVIPYTIEPNIAPVVESQIDDMVFGAIARKKELDLSAYFYDADGEPLTYKVSSSSGSVAHVNLTSDKIYITSVSFGLTIVTITATDALGETCSVDFKILVRDENVMVDVYPNPVIDFLKVRPGEEVSASISIVGSNGANVFNQNLVITPFEPAQIDMSAMKGGVYAVKVNFAGKEFKTNIVKL